MAEPDIEELEAKLFAILGRLLLKGRASGVELDVTLVHVFEQRDGKVFRRAIYSDTSEALGSIGLSDRGD